MDGMHTRRAQLGFTLGETLTSLAVIGISLSLAAPGLQSLTRGNAEAAAVNQLVGTLHAARSAAVTRNTQVAVCASASGERCDGRDWADGWITFVDRNADEERAPTEEILEQAPPLAGYRLASADYPGSLGYRADGRPADPATGEFAFCAAGAEEAGKVVILRANGLPALSGTGRDGAPVRCRAG
jgi:type IV fimbrial biogenesis protein FimT